MPAPSQPPCLPQEFQRSAEPPLREDTDCSVVSSIADSEAGLLDHGKRRSGGWLGAMVQEETLALTLKQGSAWRPAVAFASALALLALVYLAFHSAATQRPGQDPKRRPGQDPKVQEEARPEPRPTMGPEPPCRGHALKAGVCPLRSLLADPDVHAVSAMNMLKVAEDVLNVSDQEMVTQTVAEVFAEVSRSLEQRAAVVASELDQIDLTELEKEAVLVHLGLISDERVRSVGLDVARAIHESRSPEREYLRKRIQEKLIPRIREMDDFTSEVIPDRLIVLWGAGRLWSLTLDPTNVRSMESVSGHLASSLHPAQPLLEEQKKEAVRDGALEMAKVLLDFLLLCVNDMGPEWNTDVHDTIQMVDDGSLSWPCQFDEKNVTQKDFDKALVCPLKFGAQGLDALRALQES